MASLSPSGGPSGQSSRGSRSPRASRSIRAFAAPSSASCICCLLGRVTGIFLSSLQTWSNCCAYGVDGGAPTSSLVVRLDGSVFITFCVQLPLGQACCQRPVRLTRCRDPLRPARASSHSAQLSTGTVSGIGHHRTPLRWAYSFPFASVVCPRKLLIRFCVVLAGGSPVGRPSVPRPGSHVRVDRPTVACAAGSALGQVGARRSHTGRAPGSAGAVAESPAPGGLGQGLSATNARLRTRLLCRSYIANSLLPTRNMSCPDPGARRVVKSQVDVPAGRRVMRARAALPPGT